MKIAVVGLGKMGASVCADLKALSIASEVTGVDKDSEAVAFCVSEGLVDKGFDDPGKIPPGTEICVLAVPVDFMETISLGIFASSRPGLILTDVGSVKAPIVASINRILPEDVSFVPAHPIAGDETHGARNYKRGIFKDNPVVVACEPDEASKKVEAVWEKMGARILRMSPEKHDRMFAFVSHLPHVCAYSLASAAASARSEGPDVFSISGGGLRDTTRIAMSEPEMWAGILIQNSGPVLEALEGFSREVDAIGGAVRSGNKKELVKLLKRGREAKSRFLKKDRRF